MNRTFLIGNVGNDPETLNFDNGGKIVKLSLATSESWKDKTTGEKKTRTEWHNLVFRREGLAGVVEQYVKKGHKLAVEGTIRYRSHGEGDEKKYYTDIDVDSMEMLTAKNDTTAPSPSTEAEQDLPF